MSIIQVDRASFELRRGRAVVIGKFSFVHPEFLTETIWRKIKNKNPKLIITALRAKNIFRKNFVGLVEIEIGQLNLAEIAGLIAREKFSKNAQGKNTVDAAAKAAIELARIAELLPCVIKYRGAEDSLKITSAQIANYKKRNNSELMLATEAPLKLQYAKNAYVKAFRPLSGGSEHLAIIIGTPGKEPLIRVHSSCYTGDLLGSLACDCGDQLKAAIRLMDKEGGGIILYLLQEGRGIGLINKLRTYAMQAEGLDTVEANEFFGFDDEERIFAPAVTILKGLGVKKVRLLSNNPKKSLELEKLGIKVVKLIPLVIKHDHNRHYLETKSKKSGHIIN